MERLKDGQVKLGVARYEQYADSQRRIVNEIRTGTVSREIFRFIGISPLMACTRSASVQVIYVILDRLYHQFKNIRNSSEYNYWFLNSAPMITFHCTS
jgi:hypothetical protein